MRYNKYYGTFWIVLEGKDPRFDDDIISIKLENLFRIKNEFNFFSIRFKNKTQAFRVVIFSLGISIYTR